jgi:hypothetical protein
MQDSRNGCIKQDQRVSRILLLTSFRKTLLIAGALFALTLPACERDNKMPDSNGEQEGIYFEYIYKASQGRGRIKEETERYSFRMEQTGIYTVSIEPEFVRQFYDDAYGRDFKLDEVFQAENGMLFQIHGACPFRIPDPYRHDGAEFSWAWDGAGVNEPGAEMRGRIIGGKQWNGWQVSVLELPDMPEAANWPACYFEEKTGYLVGLHQSVEVPGEEPFIMMDLKLVKSNAEGLGVSLP